MEMRGQLRDAWPTGAGSSEETIATVAGWVAAAARITVLTGAGVSTDSGVPDFRGPNGVWTRDPAAQQMVTFDAYVSDRALRVRAWQRRRDHPAWSARPNAAHHALVALERSGRLRALLTQNIDGLHQRAGNSPDKVLELHGTLFTTECIRCGDRRPMAEALDRVAAGEDDPPCLRCGGIIKSASVSFGQALDRTVFAAAAAAARDCELFLAVGTTLQVQPAASLAGGAVAAGARLVIINQGRTPYDEVAELRVSAPIGAVLPRLVSGLAG